MHFVLVIEITSCLLTTGGGHTGNGTAYGNATAPVTCGSGGGASSFGAGGSGGGAISITANGKLNLLMQQQLTVTVAITAAVAHYSNLCQHC
jgi:hypothetical protein